MPVLLPSNIERRPLAVPVEWYSFVALVEVVQFLKVVIFDCSSPPFVEETKSDLILGIGLSEKVLEVTPVMKADTPKFAAVRDLEKYSVLLSSYFVLIEQGASQYSQNTSALR